MNQGQPGLRHRLGCADILPVEYIVLGCFPCSGAYAIFVIIQRIHAGVGILGMPVGGQLTARQTRKFNISTGAVINIAENRRRRIDYY